MLTVKDLGSNSFGCQTGTAGGCSAALTDATFNYDGVDYTVRDLTYGGAGDSEGVTIAFDKNIPAAFKTGRAFLRITADNAGDDKDSADFSFSRASIIAISAAWTPIKLHPGWSAGQERRVFLYPPISPRNNNPPPGDTVVFPPVSVDAESGHGELHVNWDTFLLDDQVTISSFDIDYRRENGSWNDSTVVSVNIGPQGLDFDLQQPIVSHSHTIGSLTNDVVYEVRVTPVASSGERGEPATAKGTPNRQRVTPRKQCTQTGTTRVYVTCEPGTQGGLRR